MILVFPKVNDTDIRGCQSVQNVGDDFGRGHLLNIILNIGKVHQLQTFHSISRVKLLLSLMEPTDHQHVNLVVLVDVVFALLDSFNQLLLELLVALPGG